MQAIILAAGMGKRLKELTQDRTKCMVQVNGVALIDRMLHQIERRHLSRIVIVVGYEGEKLMEYIDTLGIRTPIVYVHNPIYDKTNNIYSLALAKDYLPPQGSRGLWQTGECCVFGGRVWRSRQDRNAYSPGELPASWEDLGSVQGSSFS